MSSPYEAAIRLKQVYDSVCHERHGIITSLLELNESPVAPGLFSFHATMVNPLYFRTNGPPPQESTRAGTGVDFTRSGALWSTIGETVERYAASIYDPDAFLCATAAELGERGLDLRKLILFSEDQYERNGFPFSRPDPEVKRHWVEAKGVGREFSRFVPVELVYLSPALAGRRKELAQNCSTGLACGQSLDQAVLSGLCEVIERDAFSSMWQLRYSPARLVLDDATEERLLPGVRQYLREGPLAITLWSLVTDIGVPVVMALAESVTPGIFALGASCRLDPADAINKAVMEALHTTMWAEKMMQCGTEAPGWDDIHSPETHMCYWLDPTRRTMAKFLFADRAPLSSSTLPSTIKNLTGLVDRLEQLDFSPLFVDVTTDDVASLDLRVVRAIIPGLHPLVFGPDYVPEDPRRLRQLAAFWETPFPAAYNPLPHPFP